MNLSQLKLISDTNEVELQAAQQIILEMLAAQGVEELTEAETLAAIYVGGQLAMNSVSETSAWVRANQLEQIRIHAINWGLDMSVWGNIIDQLFSPQ